VFLIAIKITSSTGAGDWIHKDSAAKTIYSLGAAGSVISRVYNNEGTLIKYNGRKLGEDLDDDTSSQDTDDQQEVSEGSYFNPVPDTSFCPPRFKIFL
jgi:hypothetical protein